MKAATRGKAGFGGLMNRAADIEAIDARNRAASDAKMKAMGRNSDGTPFDVTYRNKLNQDGTLQNQYQLQAQPDVQVDQRAQNAIRDRALTQGPSAWALMAKEKQALEQTQALEDASVASAQARNNNLNSMMQRGGVSSGSRERMMKSSARDAMMMQQQARRQGIQDRMGIDLQDDQTKQELFKTTTGLDYQKANLNGQNRDFAQNTQNINLGRTFEEQAQQRQFDMEQYKSNMAAWGAGKTAQAQRDAAASQRGGKK